VVAQLQSTPPAETTTLKTPEATRQLVKLTAQDIVDACQKMFDQSE